MEPINWSIRSRLDFAAVVLMDYLLEIEISEHNRKRTITILQEISSFCFMGDLSEWESFILDFSPQNIQETMLTHNFDDYHLLNKFEILKLSELYSLLGQDFCEQIDNLIEIGIHYLYGIPDGKAEATVKYLNAILVFVNRNPEEYYLSDKFKPQLIEKGDVWGSPFMPLSLENVKQADSPPYYWQRFSE